MKFKDRRAVAKSWRSLLSDAQIEEEIATLKAELREWYTVKAVRRTDGDRHIRDLEIERRRQKEKREREKRHAAYIKAFLTTFDGRMQ